MMRLLLFFLIIIFSNLSYSDDNNQLLINKPAKIVDSFKIENLNRPNKSIVYPIALIFLLIIGFLNHRK